MPESFHHIAWLRRHPLTVLLLVATICVDAVAITLAANFEYLVNLLLFSLLISQISLLAWWTTAPGAMLRLRLVVLFLAVLGFSSISTTTTQGPRFADILAFFSVQAIVISVVSWFCWRMSYSASSIPRSKTQFSMRQLIAAMTVCAILSALSSFANFKVLAALYTLVLLGNAIVLGICGPGSFLIRWPRWGRWMWPLLLGLVFAIISIRLASGFPPRAFWFHNGIAAVVYSIWGLHVWGSSRNLPPEPDAEGPHLAADPPQA